MHISRLAEREEIRSECFIGDHLGVKVPMTWLVGLPSPGKIVHNGLYLDRMNRERMKVLPQDAQLYFIVFDTGGSLSWARELRKPRSHSSQRCDSLPSGAMG